MTTYKNLSGKSSVTRYYSYNYKISIYFRPTRYSGEINYQYDDDSAGSYAMGKMRELAIAGRGLNSFIKKFGPNHFFTKVM